ncbi:MAG TPA: peptide chain release factor 1, partial [Thermoplasmatales archaeon]|nr:peptide chain release factor 1 [Thermoplasmatales archaeon]
MLDKTTKYKFKKKLEELKSIKGQHTELISLYIPPNRRISDVMNHLRDEYAQSSNIKSKQTRKNVLSAIESIMARLRYFKEPPPNGMVFFVGMVGEPPKLVAEIVEPPVPINIYLYRCDSQFYTEPLEKMLEEKDIYGLLLIDRRECTIGFLIGSRIELAAYLTSRVPGKHKKGGQSQRRFERLTEIAAHEWFSKAGEKANQLFLEKGDNLKGVLVGGPGPTKREFVNGNYLDYRIKKKIVGLYDTGYTDEYGLRELVNAAANDLEELDVIKEQKLMKRFLNEIRKDSGLAIYGEEEVRKALEMGALEVVMISDALQKYKIKAICKNCGYEINDVVENLDIKCPKCQLPMEIVEKKDIVEEYAELAEKSSTQFEIIGRETEEGEILYKAFGGIAGILRYKLN